MKSKKSISMILAATVLSTGISFLPVRASAVTKESIKVESKEINKKTREAVKKAINDLNEENIKEARKMITQVEDSNLKYVYQKALEYNIYKNIDKKVSAIDELALALEKTNKITSCESNVKVDIIMEGENLTQEEMQTFAPMMQIINSIKIDGTSKFIGNGKNTEMSANMDLDLSFMNQIYNMNAWLDMNMEGENPKMRYVISIPEPLKAMSPQLQGKEYIVYDTEKIAKELAVNVDYEKMMNSSMQFGKKLEAALGDFLLSADAKFDLVTRDGVQTVNVGKGDEEVQLYQIKLDNKKLIEVLKFALQDKEMNKLMKDYVRYSINLGAEMQNEKLTPEELEELEVFIDEGLKEFVVMLEEMSKMMSYELVFDYGVNKEGYVTYQTGSIMVTVDQGKLEGVDNGSKYTFGMNFFSDAYNINGKVNVEALPEVNEENSVDYVDLLMQSVPSTEEPIETVDTVETVESTELE